ncbi:restriction endonuclease [Chitinophaga niabensis]|uniref:restriction endonuclease n=1 Tax=Chitinophaga niabensis TaxID=536979 RepID=UPI0031B9C11C
MTTNLEKGDELEDAVEAVEKFLIAQNPGLRTQNIRIQRKKIIIVDGVKHEIDLYVEIDFGLGSPFIYIFECKNWEENVNKNEIIVFSEKIQCVNAQNGYFIAKGFSTYAEAQAKRDSRIKLLIATKELDKFPFIGFSNSFSTETAQAEFGFLDESGSLIKFEPDVSSLVAEGGNLLDFKEFGSRLINNFVTKKYDVPMTIIESTEKTGFYMGYTDSTETGLPVGEHIFEDQFMSQINGGKIYVNGTTAIAKVTCKVKHKIVITAPIFIWQYDVESKGKVALIRYELTRGQVDIKAVGADQYKVVHLHTTRKDILT